MTQLVTIEEAGRRMGVGRSRAYRLARAGELPVVEVAGVLRVPLVALEARIAALAERAVGRKAEND